MFKCRSYHLNVEPNLEGVMDVILRSSFFEKKLIYALSSTNDLDLLGKGQVAEGEIEGLLRGTERALIRGVDHILLVSDSQAGLKAILSTSPRAGQFCTIQYDEIVHVAMTTLPALRITNLWTPAHIGTIGNEFADDAAKAATLLPPLMSMPVSLTMCKHSINCEILEKWKMAWKVATLGKGLHEIDNSPPSLILRSPYLSSASRTDISTLLQLRTDFSQLNTHCFKC
jgi:hypothetical protein